MQYLNEDGEKLIIKTFSLNKLKDLNTISVAQSNVFLFTLPHNRNGYDEIKSPDIFRLLNQYLISTPQQSTLCILTSPPNAAKLLSSIAKNSLIKFQHWVAIKADYEKLEKTAGKLPKKHVALLVLTRYQHSLQHCKIRIPYTYCPSCNKTTKDYGGKKHLYHKDGTLISDVWRDMVYDGKNIEIIADRLSDLFSITPYTTVYSIDLRNCKEITQTNLSTIFTRKNNQSKNSKSSLDSQLLNADCLEALAKIPSNSIDFCFADPPYNIHKNYERWHDKLELLEYFSWCNQWLTELARVLKPGRTLAVLNIPLWAANHYSHLAAILDFQAWIVWDALSFPVRKIMPAHYAILCFSKGQARNLPGLTDKKGLEESIIPLPEFYCSRTTCIKKRNSSPVENFKINDLWHDIHRLKHNSQRADHPCQLPPKLMRRLFALFTNPNEIILDCFNGVGTSTLVAAAMNRKFIGIELSSTYHHVAISRHEILQAGQDPFAKNKTIPKAKNSRVGRLPKQKYSVSKKQLQLEIKQIAGEIGRLPTKIEVAKLSKYPIEYFEQYFMSWGEVCAAARTTGMTEKAT